MSDIDNHGRPFWRTAFSESDGTGSLARVISAIVAINTLFIADLVAIHIKAIPDLTTLSVFTSSIIGVLYGVNKISTKASDAVVTYRTITNPPPGTSQ